MSRLKSSPEILSFANSSFFLLPSYFTLLRDSDKVAELMNLHRRSDTPLGSPVCLRLADRMGAVAKGIRRSS